MPGTGKVATESTAYAPSSPYSATKASADHLALAWYRTYGLPVTITHGSNNYGPFQFPDKLIPRIIVNALTGRRLEVYGRGHQIRDWIYVDDHASALVAAASQAQAGETYNIGGSNQKQNIEVVNAICELLEELHPEKPAGVQRYQDLITFVEDPPGHDLRYALNSSKIQREFGWVPRETFTHGLRKTVLWYLENRDWWQSAMRHHARRPMCIADNKDRR